MGFDRSKSPIAQELAKWEQHPNTEYTMGGLKPGNPFDPNRKYPKMLYKAQRLSNGKWAVSQPPPSRFEGFPTDQEWDRACQAAQKFTESCQTIVKDERERTAFLENGEGWRDTPTEAMEFREKLQEQVSTAAAERAYADRNMSDKAKAEVEAKEEAHFGHMGEIPAEPAPPKRKRGRPRKKVA